MTWEPLGEEALWDMINAETARMGIRQRRFWEAMRIFPAKWRLPVWGDEGGGFWAVALMGELVLWYNDIEDGFNISPYSDYGVIGEYRCSQEELTLAVQKLLWLAETGEGFSYAGPPRPLE